MAKKPKADKGQGNGEEQVTFGNRLEETADDAELEGDAADPGDEEEPEEADPEDGDEGDDDGDDQGDEGEEDPDEGDEDADDDQDEEEETDADEDDETEEETEEETPAPKKKKAAEETADEDPGEDRQVPLTALISERKKSKDRITQLEEENRRLREGQGLTPTEGDGSAVSPDAVKELRAEFKDVRTKDSIRSAQRHYKDYAEKAQAVQDLAKVKPQILDMIEASEDPGEEAYRLGEEILYQKKYGDTREKQHAALTKEITAALEKSIRAKVEKELREKLQKKRKEPTNISTSRASGGSDALPYRGQSFGRRLAVRR